MKKLTFIIVCLMATCLGVNAQSNNAAYEAELDKAVSLSSSKELLSDLFEQGFQQFVQSGQMSQANCHAMSVDMADIMQPKLVSLTKELWSKTFNYDELKKVTAWLQSTEGQKMLMLTKETGKIQQQLMQDPEFIQHVTGLVTKYMGK